jgi:hypothetical protein
MSTLFAAGQYANLLERALSVTMSPADDYRLPKANLYDGRSSRAARHESNGVNPSITADLAAFTPAGPATYTITVRAGERRCVTGTGSSTVTIRNLATGRYLTSAGAWQAGAANVLAAAGTVQYQVESFTVCQAATVSLQIVLSGGGSTVADWPACNAIAVWGHNLDPGLTVEMRSSTDNFSGSNVLEVTGAIQQPSFLLLDAAPSYNRYLRLALTGTNQATPWYAEVIPCYLETAVTTLGLDHEVTYDWAQIRSEGPYGETVVYSQSTWPRRIGKWRFNMDVAKERETREEIIFRCQGGAYPLLFVPTSSDAPPAVLFGRLDSRWATTRNLVDIWSTDLTLAEGSVPTPLT